MDVGTSPDPVPSPLPLEEKPSALIRGKYLISLHGLPNDDGCWIDSPRCGSDSLESFPPYPGRSSSAHTSGTLFSYFTAQKQLCRLFLSQITSKYMLTFIIFIVNDTTISLDTESTALTQDNLELAYPFPMDVDTMNPTEPAIDSQTSSIINTNNSEAVSRTQENTALSNASVTTTKAPYVETNTTVHLSMSSGLASPRDAQTSKNIITLDGSAHKNDKPADIHDARLTPGELLFVFFLFFFSSFTAQLCRTADYSKGSLDELI